MSIAGVQWIRKSQWKAGKERETREQERVKVMLPYSAVALDYAAYQSRPGLSSAGNGASFTHSWLVPTQDLCGVNFKPNQHQNQLIVDPGHVENFLFFYFFIFISFYLSRGNRTITAAEKWFLMFASIAWNLNRHRESLLRTEIWVNDPEGGKMKLKIAIASRFTRTVFDVNNFSISSLIHLWENFGGRHSAGTRHRRWVWKENVLRCCTITGF